MIAFRAPVGVTALHELQVKAVMNAQKQSIEPHSVQADTHSQGSEIGSDESSG